MIILVLNQSGAVVAAKDEDSSDYLDFNRVDEVAPSRLPSPKCQSMHGGIRMLLPP